MWVLGTFRLFLLAFHTPNLKSNSIIFWKEFLILKKRASLLPIIFAPSGRMIGHQRGTHTSPVESFVLLFTILSTTSTFVLEALFSGRLLVYQWAPTVHLYWLISSFIPSSTISWSKQWNRILQKPSNSATPSGTSTIYSVLTMWTLEITSAQFTRRNWNLKTLPHHLVCYLDTNIKAGDNTPFHISIYDKREDFAFRIVNFPHMDSNIPANPAYGVYISQLVRYARICTSKVDFINRLRGLSIRLRQQGFDTNLLQKSFNKFFSCHGLIVEKYGAALRGMRLAIQAWIAPSYPYITYLLLSVVFQFYLGRCARTILFWARALFVYLFDVYIKFIY